MGAIFKPYSNQLATPGQVKPNGIPRIDWTHPLAQGLICYWFDTGNNQYIDLVTGQYSVLGTGSSYAPIDASQFGTGTNYPLTTGSPACMQANATFPRQSWADPFSSAVGFNVRGITPAAGASWFGISDASANDAVGLYFSTNLYFSLANNAGAQLVAGGIPAVGFHVAACSTTGASSTTAWLDGVQTGTSANTTTYAGSGMYANINTYQLNDTTHAGCGSQVFFGAVWARRLSQDVAKQLYLDPYCFLIPTEPELQALQLPVVGLGGGIQARRTILPPWPNQLWTPPQVKPQGVPQIDWQHPLAQNLACYWFDTGLGFYIDLVSGNLSVVGSGSTAPPIDASPFGTGFNFPTSGAHCIQDSAAFSQQAWAPPYSVATGWFQKAQFINNPALFGLCDASANDAFFIVNVASGGNHLNIYFGNISTASLSVPQANMPANGTFNVIVGSAFANNTQTLWLNGGSTIVNGSIPNTSYTGSGMRLLTQQAGVNGTTSVGSGGAVFFGAAWNRTLSQSEAQLLYTDPYCFLIPAEPELQALYAAAAAVVSGQKGATLPFMGVG